MFLRKGVMKICSKFTGEHPCRSVISIKFQGSFLLKIKIGKKQALHSSLFKGENNPKTFLKCQVF